MSESTDFSDCGSPFPYESLVPPSLREPAGVRLIPGARSHLGLVYRAVLGYRPLRLDLHLPLAADGPTPIVLYVHGGSFIGGVPEMGPWTSLPGRGIAVAALSYRLAGEAPFPAPVDDIRSGLSWLREHSRRWGLDRDRFGLWGSSAGGFLAAIAALSPTADTGVDAVVCHYPLTSPGLLAEDALADGLEAAERLHSIAARACPQMPAAADFIDSDRRLPTFLLVHGTADSRVGPIQSRRLHSALLAAGGDSTLRLVPGADHGSAEFYSTEAAAEVTSFFQGAWAS